MTENPNPYNFQPSVSSHRARSVVVTKPTGKNPSIIKWLILGFLVLAMLAMGLITLLLMGYIFASQGALIFFIMGIIAAILPVPVYLTLVIWLDRFEPEPWWLMALTFMWGAMGSVFFSFIINSVGGELVSNMFGPAVGQIYGASVSAPIVEETTKAMALFAIFFFMRREFDGVLDGIIYAALVGLGFAMTENFLYYGKFFAGGDVIWYFIRGILLAFAHPVFTSMTGIGLGIAAESKNTLVKIVAPIVGFGMAIFLHFFNNTIIVALAAVLGGLGVLVGLPIICFGIPILGSCIVGLAGFSLYRESKKIREFLQADISAGRLTAQEVQRIGSVFGRIGASFSALKNGGFKGWQAMQKFHQIATELAFFRSNIAKGLILQDTNAVLQEQEYANALSELRPQLPAV